MNRTQRSGFAALLLVLVFSSAVFADRVDDIVRARMSERNIPGAAIAVIRNGKIVKMQGYGFASVEFEAPVTADTVFEIGSVSKQMTAAGIMLLVEDGKVRLDEKISAYLPNTPDAWKDVTVRHLLTHTSGIKSYSSLDGFELARRVKIDGFIKQLSPHPLEFIPGEKNIYSNSGFNLLAYIIETQSGKNYLQFMQERIFIPLGMKKTFDRDPQFVIPKRANGYELRNGNLSGRDGSLTDLMGAGSIVSTISDMAKWESALRGNEFLKPESKREIWTQFTFNNGDRSPYGLGWRISEVRSVKLIGHTGQTAGFGAAIFRYVDDDVTVIALTNLGESGMGSLLASAVARSYIPRLSLTTITSTLTATPQYADRIERGIRGRHSNTVDEVLFSPEVLRSMRSERAVATNLRLQRSGKISSVNIVSQKESAAGTTYGVVVKAGARIFLWQVSVDKTGLITELILEEEE